MGTFPMAMSLAASFITAIELLGNPAEMYEQVCPFSSLRILRIKMLSYASASVEISVTVPQFL